jgi:hypothetical protein
LKRVEGLSEKIPLPVDLLPSGIKATQPGTSAFQLASLLEQILRATLVARKLARGRSASELTTRLEPESWSVAECLDHLACTTNVFLPEISKAIAAAPKLATSRTLRTGTVALLLIRNLEPPYRLRYKVIPQLVPQQTDFDAAWTAFEQSQLRLSETVCSATGLAIDKRKVQCPVCAHVTYNVYGALRMLAAHQRCHLWQVQKILGALDGKRAQKTAV